MLYNWIIMYMLNKYLAIWCRLNINSECWFINSRVRNEVYIETRCRGKGRADRKWGSTSGPWFLLVCYLNIYWIFVRCVIRIYKMYLFYEQTYITQPSKSCIRTTICEIHANNHLIRTVCMVPLSRVITYLRIYVVHM